MARPAEGTAGGLSWDCWQTVEHLADDLFSYAAQLGPRPAPADHYVPFEATAREPGGTVNGLAGPEGFAAMGVLETLVHTYDVAQGLSAQGLSVPWCPPEALCARVLARLMPDVA